LADEHDHEEEQVPAEPGDEQLSDEQAVLDEMLDTIRQAKVAPLILSTVSTFASVAYGKLEMGDLPEAKLAIDAIDALLPFLQGQVDDSIRRDFEQALANLKLAYADAVASAE
jgi:hypothetical protein